MSMKIAIGSDHAGFELKEQLITYLRSHNNNVIDEKNSPTIFLNGLEYYVEPSCYYMF